MDLFNNKKLAKLKKELSLKEKECKSLKSDLEILERENHHLKSLLGKNTKVIGSVKSSAPSFIRSAKASEPSQNNTKREVKDAIYSNSNNGALVDGLVLWPLAINSFGSESCDTDD
ncbi:hypothetical protein [Pseudoalteromonas sp. MQS005]|uniref:hypothetical protein n=1 Tax=Pseudoalteromonas sp. MQS005 TaxID=1854052 RepID=UPI0007E518C6|nr:hypothetical protein [Pseudoalteromonas sp. MQS005]